MYPETQIKFTLTLVLRGSALRPIRISSVFWMTSSTVMLVNSSRPSIAIGYTKFRWSDEEERNLSEIN